LLTFGCAVISAVVLYSACLALSLTSEDTDLRETTAALESKRAQTQEYQKCLDEVAKDLIAARRSLLGAVRRLAEMPKSQDPTWLDIRRNTHNVQSEQEMLAINIVAWSLALLSAEGSWQAEQRAVRLEEDFQALFGCELPAWVILHNRFEPQAGGDPHAGKDRPEEGQKNRLEPEPGSSEWNKGWTLHRPVVRSQARRPSPVHDGLAARGEGRQLLSRTRSRCFQEVSLGRTTRSGQSQALLNRVWNAGLAGAAGGLFYPAPFP
jgi:hypothetical protein